MLGASGTITVILHDESLADDGRDPILEVIHRTEPVQPCDILALSDGTEVKVLGIWQIFEGGHWEQVASVWTL